MKKYVLGFYIWRSPDGDEVWLIRKNNPAWQRGHLNGIGGKVEPGESAERAMWREFYEEAGVRLDWGRQHYFATMTGVETADKVGTETGTMWLVDCFAMITTDRDQFLAVHSCTAEECVRVKVRELDKWSSLTNVGWLIGMAIDRPPYFVHNRQWLNDR